VAVDHEVVIEEEDGCVFVPVEEGKLFWSESLEELLGLVLLCEA
jgi:hypothetical protein